MVVCGPMYLRFVVAEIHPKSGKELGVFHAVGYLRDDGKLAPHEEEQHDEIRKWFNAHLKQPTKFTASKPPFYRKQSKAISWFKDTAHEHIDRIRLLVEILRNHGISVQMLKTERVGYVVWPLAAREPVSENPCRKLARLEIPLSEEIVYRDVGNSCSMRRW
jgi:hypothetical protein